MSLYCFVPFMTKSIARYGTTRLSFTENHIPRDSQQHCVAHEHQNVQLREESARAALLRHPNEISFKNGEEHT